MWLRGTYTSYTNYDLSVVGLVQQDGQTVGSIRYTDATPANTTLANGSALTTTGPNANGGATDDLWHRRDGFGNGNEVFTAGEGGDENAPALQTTIANVAAGEYDVFGFFWANPSEEWQIALGLSDDDLRTFRKDFAEQADADDFEASMVLTVGAVSLYKAYLGRVVADDRRVAAGVRRRLALRHRHRPRAPGSTASASPPSCRSRGPSSLRRPGGGRHATSTTPPTRALRDSDELVEQSRVDELPRQPSTAASTPSRS